MNPHTHSCRKRILPRREKGFSLIEVLIGIVVLTIGLLGMLSLLIGIINGNKFSRDMTTATVLAKNKLEQIESLGYYGISSTDTVESENYGSISNYPAFKRTTSIDTDNPASNMKKVAITVYWDSDAHSCALQTIVAR